MDTATVSDDHELSGFGLALLPAVGQDATVLPQPISRRPKPFDIMRHSLEYTNIWGHDTNSPVSIHPPGVRLSHPLARPDRSTEPHLDHRDEVVAAERAAVRAQGLESVERRLIAGRQFQQIGEPRRSSAGPTSTSASSRPLKLRARWTTATLRETQPARREPD